MSLYDVQQLLWVLGMIAFVECYKAGVPQRIFAWAERGRNRWL